MRMWLYYLDNNNKLRRTQSSFVWLKKMSIKRWQLVDVENGGVRVSTVFLGLNHNLFSPNLGMALFETTIFGGKHDGETYRYATLKAAKEGHVACCKKARK